MSHDRSNANRRELGLISHRRLRKALCVIAAILILKPYTFSYGDTNGTFRLVNGTGHYIDATINGKSALFLAPGSTFAYEFNAPATIFANVAYSPAQGVRGSASRTFSVDLQDNYNNSTNTNYYNNDCGGAKSKGNDCGTNTTSSGSVTTSVNPASWVVTEDSLTVTGGVGL